MNRSQSNSSMLPSPSSVDTDKQQDKNELRRKMALQASLLETSVKTDVTPCMVVKEPKLVSEDAPCGPEKKMKKTKRNRCFSCRKKVGILGFECRCGDVFCGGCRMPEDHECTADWTTGIKTYEKVVASKLDKL